jgi:hypothetical protein
MLRREMPSPPFSSALTRTALISLLLVPGALLSACGGSSTTSSSPTGSAVTASSTSTAGPTPTGTATATPTPAPAPTACTGAELSVVFGVQNSASGGQQGMTALLANDSSTACMLSGSLQAQLLSSTGGSLTTSLASAAPTGSAWLVPRRVALDAWWPQSGEATVIISWHTGDVQPGMCSGSAPSVGEVSLSVPGGGSVTGSLSDSMIPLSMAPCNGVIQLGAITHATTPQAFSSATAGAEAADQEEFGGAEPSNPNYQVITGTEAAVVTYNGPDCGASTYLWQDSAGWHVLVTSCSQAPGYSPMLGQDDYVYGPVSGGCADVYSSPSHTSSVVACLTFSSTTVFGQGTQYTVDQGPTYTAETDPTSQQPAGTVWWHLQGQGWVTQDYLMNLVP